MHPASREFRKDRVQLSIADERFAAHDGDVKRPMLLDECEHAVDEVLALEVAQLAQRDVASQVLITVGIAPGTSQRTLARNLNRERWNISTEDLAPTRDHVSNHSGHVNHYISE